MPLTRSTERQHRPSRARCIAGLSGSFTLSQSRDGPERRAQALRHDAFESESAGVLEYGLTILIGMLVDRCSGRRGPAKGEVHERQFFWMKQLPPKFLRFPHNWLPSSRGSGPTCAA
jgi:hypothetical protein